MPRNTTSYTPDEVTALITQRLAQQGRVVKGVEYRTLATNSVEALDAVYVTWEEAPPPGPRPPHQPRPPAPVPPPTLAPDAETKE